MHELFQHIVQPAGAAEFSFAVTLPANRRFRYAQMTFESREDWYKHTLGIIRGMNLNCSLHERTPGGYKFTFMNLKDRVIFELLACGDRPCSYTTFIDKLQPEYVPYYARAAESFLLERKIQADIEERETGVALKFATTSGRACHIMAHESINVTAYAHFKNGIKLRKVLLSEPELPAVKLESPVIKPQ